MAKVFCVRRDTMYLWYCTVTIPTCMQVCTYLTAFHNAICNILANSFLKALLLSVRPVKNNSFEGVSHSKFWVVLFHLVKGSSECLLVGI